MNGPELWSMLRSLSEIDLSPDDAQLLAPAFEYSRVQEVVALPELVIEKIVRLHEEHCKE
jgi:hypothetical protein